MDDKGRTVIPAKFRSKLGPSFVITRGLHGCLWVFAGSRWPDVQRKLVPRSFLDVSGIKLERYFLGAACECIPDKQGRVALPQMLLDHAGIKQGDCVLFVGLTDRIEIWSKPGWDSFNASLTEEEIERLGAEGDSR